jgi:hypothetical protein
MRGRCEWGQTEKDLTAIASYSRHNAIEKRENRNIKIADHTHLYWAESARRFQCLDDYVPVGNAQGIRAALGAAYPLRSESSSIDTLLLLSARMFQRRHSDSAILISCTNASASICAAAWPTFFGYHFARSSGARRAARSANNKSCTWGQLPPAETSLIRERYHAQDSSLPARRALVCVACAMRAPPWKTLAA